MLPSCAIRSKTNLEKKTGEEEKTQHEYKELNACKHIIFSILSGFCLLPRILVFFSVVVVIVCCSSLKRSRNAISARERKKKSIVQKINGFAVWLPLLPCSVRIIW
jgi:hypothetical protein